MSIKTIYQCSALKRKNKYFGGEYGDSPTLSPAYKPDAVLLSGCHKADRSSGSYSRRSAYSAFDTDSRSSGFNSICAPILPPLT